MRTKEAGPGCIISVGVLFLSAGVGIAAWGVHGWLVYRRSATWAKIPATIKSVEFKVCPTKGKRRAKYTLKCRYSYEFDGKTYTSDRLSIMGATSGYKGGRQEHRYEELLGHNKRGDPFTALVDPDDPKTAILYREAGFMYAMVPFGLVFATIGGVVLAVGMMGLRAKKRREVTGG